MTKTPTPKCLTESQKDLVAVAVGEAVAKIHEEQQSGEKPMTPTPHDSTEMAQRALAYHNCKKEGPAKELGERMDRVETKQQAQQDFINQYLGEQKFKRYAVPLLVGLMGSGLGALVVGLVIKGIQHAR